MHFQDRCLARYRIFAAMVDSGLRTYQFLALDYEFRSVPGGNRTFALVQPDAIAIRADMDPVANSTRAS